MRVGTAVHSRPGPGEAHGQKYIQSGAMFDGARPVLALPPRCHFGVQVVLGGHDSLALGASGPQLL